MFKRSQVIVKTDNYAGMERLQILQVVQLCKMFMSQNNGITTDKTEFFLICECFLRSFSYKQILILQHDVRYDSISSASDAHSD